MLWSLTKVVLFLLLIACLAVVADMLSDSGEALRISAAGLEFTLGPVQAVIAALLLLALVWLVLKLLGLLSATLHFLNGDETAISRYFDRNRERKGYAAMSEALVALASGESAAAMNRARTAERLLRKPELTTLLVAQAAEASGDGRAAVNAWKSLLSNEQTRFAAMRGLRATLDPRYRPSYFRAIPTIVFHGDLDTTVHARNSLQAIVQASPVAEEPAIEVVPPIDCELEMKPEVCSYLRWLACEYMPAANCRVTRSCATTRAKRRGSIAKAALSGLLNRLARTPGNRVKRPPPSCADTYRPLVVRSPRAASSSSGGASGGAFSGGGTCVRVA